MTPFHQVQLPAPSGEETISSSTDGTAAHCGSLKVFTDLSRDAIADLDRHRIERPHARQTQRVLAAEVTALVHGPEEARRAPD